MNDPRQIEYDAVHTQIRERKAELKAKDIPNKLKALITTVRKNRLHPLLREVVSKSEDQASFVFNGNSYSIEFKKSSPFWVPTGPRVCSATLIARKNSDVVLESQFEATEDEWGLEFDYKDTAIYRRGDWVDELLKLKQESDELRRVQEKAYFQSREQLESLRERFALPKQAISVSTPPPIPISPMQQSRPAPSASSGGRASGILWSFVRKILGI